MMFLFFNCLTDLVESFIDDLNYLNLYRMYYPNNAYSNKQDWHLGPYILSQRENTYQ